MPSFSRLPTSLFRTAASFSDTNTHILSSTEPMLLAAAGGGVRLILRTAEGRTVPKMDRTPFRCEILETSNFYGAALEKH